MKISEAGLALIKRFEGVRLAAYDDGVGIWTIGYGHVDGVKQGDTCTQEQADEWLQKDCYRAETCVNQSIVVPLTQPEFDALVSFVFNVGCRAFRDSTLRRKLNDSDFDGAESEFQRWDKAGGKTMAGLTKRRMAEKELFASAPSGSTA